MSLINKRTIYLASYIDTDYDEYGNPIQIYDKPVSIDNCVLNSLNGSYDLAVYGDSVKKMAKTLLDYSWIDKIKEKDAIYLYEISPEKEKVNGENANYIVDAVLPQNKKIVVYFKKRI